MSGTHRWPGRMAFGLSLAITALSLCLGPVPAAAELRAGAARASITPDPQAIPYPLGGYVTPSRVGHNATGVADDCFARALVLTDGHTRCALVGLDLCFMPANVKAAVLARITATGIPADGLFLSCTHTHSAPDPLALHSANTPAAGRLTPYDPRLADWMAGQIARAITEANRALRPARVGAAQKQGIGLNRNRRDEGLTDDELTVIKVVGADDRPIAAVVNYAAHPTVYGADMMKVSGDWSGALERAMETALPGAVALFVNGAEGDASVRGAEGATPAERIRTYVEAMMAHARPLYDSIAATAQGPLAAWVQETALPPRKAHPFFLLAAAAQGATLDQARGLVSRLMPTRCEASFLRIGDALLMGVPGEPTASVGLDMKRMARERGVRVPAVAALTNGWLGYLVTPAQYRAGKYEATMSFFGDGIAPAILAGVRAGLQKLGVSPSAAARSAAH